MVDKAEIRASFSARLNQALTDAGVRTRGRGVDIQKQLKRVGVRVTTQAVSKWLNAEAIPESASMSALSSWLNVRREWLEYGVLPVAPLLTLGTTSIPTETHQGLPPPCRSVPLVELHQVSGMIRNANVPRSTDYICCPILIGNRGFAVRVTGDSMVAPGFSRSYTEGSIIFADPDVTSEIGDRVIAKVPRTGETTFKVLVEDGGRKFLKPLNPQYPMIDVTDDLYCFGKVIGSFSAD